jgi:hypothetical protein
MTDGLRRLGGKHGPKLYQVSIARVGNRPRNLCQSDAGMESLCGPIGDSNPLLFDKTVLGVVISDSTTLLEFLSDAEFLGHSDKLGD